MTTFLQVSDNSETNAPAGSLNNTTSPITISGINTTKFSPVTTGYVVTIWDDISYTDPTDDPNMEKALVTAATIAASGSFTLTRPFAKAHTGTPHVALLVVAQHISDLNSAVNTAEATLASHVANTSNPHTVTKAQVGLGNADNTSDLNKPISTATQTALDAKASTASVTSGLALKENAANKSNAALGSSTTLFPTQNSVKTYVDAADALKANISSLAPVATSGVHSSLTGLDADDHPQYHNDDRGDARYAGQPYAVMAKAKFASLASSYGMLGKIFGNSGYLNDLQVYGESTQASVPTPDVPVPIASTTGDVTVRSATGTGNLFDKTDSIILSKYYGPSGEILDLSGAFIQTTYIPVSPSTQYTMSYAVSSDMRPVQYDANKNFIVRSNNSAQVHTFTTASNAAYVRISGMSNRLHDTQFERGATATPYKSFVGSTQTLPLGTTQLRSLPNGVSDRIYKSGSSWFLEQNVNEYTLSASDVGGGTPTTRPNGTQFALTAPFMVATPLTTTNMASDRFVGIPFNNRDTVANSIYGWDLDNAVRINTTVATTRDAFVAWLTANPTTIYYRRAIPVTTPITDPTLITALENIRTYQGITNITASTPVSGSYGLDLTTSLAGKVDTTGNQTIAGVKTFTSAPIAPSGTSIGGALYLTGTGFPNGVVAAPVGSIYIDTAVTNGASSWIKKSGTGNTGWQVLEGSVSKSIVAADLLNGWKFGIVTQLTLTRKGDIVTLTIPDLSLTSVDATDFAMFTVPYGYRAASSLYGNYASLGPVNRNGFRWLVKDFNLIGDYGYATSRGYYTCNITWVTSDPWPII